MIKRQVLDIYTDTQEDVWQLQNRIREIYYEKMLPMIEQACNHYDSGDILRIENLTIDLGEVSSKNLDEQIVRAFEEKINEHLSKIVYHSKYGGSNNEVRTEKIPQEISDFELIVSFLKSGVLPWWKKGVSFAKIETIFAEQIRKNAQKLRSFLIVSKQYESVVRRIVYQFSESNVKALIVAIADTRAEKVDQLTDDLKILINQLVNRKMLSLKARLVFWQVLIQAAIETSTVIIDQKYVLRRLVDGFERNGFGTKQQLIKSIHKISISDNPTIFRNSKPNDLAEAIEWLLREFVPESNIEIATPRKQNRYKSKQQSHTDDPQNLEDQSPKGDSDDRSDAELKIAEQDNTASDALDYEISSADLTHSPYSTELNPPFRIETVNEVYVKNAGLVLIWNYLPFYFRHVGLMVDSQFKNEQARSRAALLLQYLSTGEENTPEYEMPLNKLLCGIPLTEPLESSIEITEEEKLEAEVMLQTVVDHWGALGNSSPWALRQSFLNREGMLTKEDKSWTLRVEESTIDILLDKLPWGYSMVNYNWMEKPIYVEWR